MHLAKKGKEFGATTGRPRRCGWLDAVALARAVKVNGITGLCITKLDVLDEMTELKICTEYKLAGELIEGYPVDRDQWADIEPIYTTLPGWQSDTRGISTRAQLPENARNYLTQMEQLIGAPIHILSTGPERDEGSVLHNPFD